MIKNNCASKKEIEAIEKKINCVIASNTES